MEDMKKSTILIVDDEVSTLRVLHQILGADYAVFTAKSGREAIGKVKEVLPDLVLLDIVMPGIDGYKTIRHIKADPAVSRIPVIFLTSKDDAESEVDGLALGAVDYIAKPFDVSLLKKRIQLHLLVEEQKNRLREQNERLRDYNVNLQKMVDEKTEKIMRMQDAILNTIAEVIEFRDSTTGGHIERTQLYVKALVEKMIEQKKYLEEIDGVDIKPLIQSAPLHDLGKVKIPDSILNKPGKLTSDEIEVMKRHTILGKEAIHKIAERAGESDNDLLRHAAVMAYSHHEKWDGTGYPLGLKGKAIPLQGRLMAIADVYDALVSERPYKKAYPHEKAVEIIREGKGAHFDPVLTELFEGLAESFDNISQSCDV